MVIFNRHSFCVNPQMLVHIPHLSEVNPHFYWDNPQMLALNPHLRAINPHFSLDHTQTLKMPDLLPLAVPVSDVHVLQIVPHDYYVRFAPCCTAHPKITSSFRIGHTRASRAGLFSAEATAAVVRNPFEKLDVSQKFVNTIRNLS